MRYIICIFFIVLNPFVRVTNAQSNLIKLRVIEEPFEDYYKNEFNHYITYMPHLKWDVNYIRLQYNLISLSPKDSNFHFKIPLGFNFTKPFIPYKFKKSELSIVIDSLYQMREKGKRNLFIFKENPDGYVADINYIDSTLQSYINSNSLMTLFSKNRPATFGNNLVNINYQYNNNNTISVASKPVFYNFKILQNSLRINENDTLSKIHIFLFQDSLGIKAIDQPIAFESDWIVLTSQDKIAKFTNHHDPIHKLCDGLFVNDLKELYNNPNAVRFARWSTIFVTKDSNCVFSFIDLNKFFQGKFKVDGKLTSSLLVENNKGIKIELDTGGYLTTDTIVHLPLGTYHISKITYDVKNYNGNLPYQLTSKTTFKMANDNPGLGLKRVIRRNNYTIMECSEPIRSLESNPNYFLVNTNMKLIFDSKTGKLKYIEIFD